MVVMVMMLAMLIALVMTRVFFLVLLTHAIPLQENFRLPWPRDNGTHLWKQRTVNQDTLGGDFKRRVGPVYGIKNKKLKWWLMQPPRQMFGNRKGHW